MKSKWVLAVSILLNVVLLIMYFSYRRSQELQKEIIFLHERANYVAFKDHVYDVLNGGSRSGIEELKKDAKFEPDTDPEDQMNFELMERLNQLREQGKVPGPEQ